jgi:hypothetical protein
MPAICDEHHTHRTKHAFAKVSLKSELVSLIFQRLQNGL